MIIFLQSEAFRIPRFFTVNSGLSFANSSVNPGPLLTMMPPLSAPPMTFLGVSDSRENVINFNS